MTTKTLQDIAKALVETEQKRVSGDLTPVAAGAQRWDLLKEGILTLGETCGADLKLPVTQQADELSVVCNSGTYGKELSNILNNHYIRTGLVAKQGFTLPESTWGYMNHFEVEKMIIATANSSK